MAKQYDFSDFDKKDEKTKYDFSDFNNEAKDSSLVDDIEASVIKLAQGASSGFVDELAGGLEAAGTALGTKGLGGPVSDVELFSASPTLDIDTLKKAYESARDKERAQQAAISEESPILSTVSELAGGVAGTLIPGAALTKGATGLVGAAKVGKEAQALSKLGQLVNYGKKIAPSVATGAGLGGVAGVGMSEAEDLSGIAADAASSAAFGGAIGGAIPVALDAGSKAIKGVGNILRTTDKTLTGGLGKAAFDRAKNEGELPFGAKFEQNMRNRQNKLVGDVSDDLGIEGQSLRTKNEAQNVEIDKKRFELNRKLTEQDNARKNVIDDLINDARSQADELETRYAQQIDLEKQAQLTQNADKKIELVKQKNEIANNIQKSVDDRLDTLGDGFNQVDNIITENKIIVPIKEELRTAISNSEQLDSESGEILLNTFKRYLDNPNLEGDVFKVFMAKLQAQIAKTGANPALKVANEELKNLRNIIQVKKISLLEDAGFEDVAKQLKELNNSYTKTVQFKDKTRINRLTGEFDRDSGLLKNVEDFTKRNASDELDPANIFSKELQAVIPEQAPGIIKQSEVLGQETLASKTFKPDLSNVASVEPQVKAIKDKVDVLKRMKAGRSEVTEPQVKLIDAEIAKLTEELSSLQNVKLTPEDTFSSIALNPNKQKRDEDVKSLIKQFTEESARGDKSEASKKFLEQYKNLTGRDVSQDVQKLADDFKFDAEKIQGFLGSFGFIRSTAKVSGGLAGKYLARPIQKVSNALTKAGGEVFGDKPIFTDTQISNAINKLGPDSRLGKMVKEIAETTNQDVKNKKLFILSQQPWFRSAAKDNEEENAK